jgi:serine/threonine-protein kinase HipA
MSTAVYPGLTEKMAMKIGGENRPEWMIIDRWEQFSKDTGIGFKLIKNKSLKMVTLLAQIMDDLADDVHQQYGECELIGKIIELIESRSGKLMRLFKID